MPKIIMRFIKILVLVSLAVLAGCSVMPERTSTTQPSSPVSSGPMVDFRDTAKIKNALYTQLKEWDSTRYQLGGLSKAGIDCSGFVFITYQSKFGLEVPRSTKLQAKLGYKVKPNELKPGDLVFFKTGLNKRHVGIYVEDRKFVHASTSQGVTLSSLENHYWSKKYWKSVRIAN